MLQCNGPGCSSSAVKFRTGAQIGTNTHLCIMSAAVFLRDCAHGNAFHLQTLLYTAAGSGSSSAAGAFAGGPPLSGPQLTDVTTEQLPMPLQDNSGILFQGLRVRMAMATGIAVVDIASAQPDEEQHMLPGHLPVSAARVGCCAVSQSVAGEQRMASEHGIWGRVRHLSGAV